MPSLRIKTGQNRGQVFPILDKPVTIGRDPACTIQVYDTAASRTHAEVFAIGEMYFVRDLGSRNRSFVNEQQIEEELLRVGDKIRIGSTIIVFEDAEAEAKASDPEKGVPEVKYHDQEPAEGFSTSTIELNLDRKKLGEIAVGGGKEVAAHLGILLDLSRTISAEQNLRSLLDKVLGIAAESAGAKLGILFLRDTPSGQFIARAHVGIVPGSDVRVSRTIIRKVAQHGRPILTSDATEDSRFRTTDSVVLQGIHSVICVPLVSLEQVIGILYVESPGVEKPFRPEDLDLITAIGLQAAIAIQNVQTQHQQRRTMAGAIRTLVAAMEMQNPTMQGHSARVATYAAALAQQMGLSEAENHEVQLVGLLHDVGKIAVAGGTRPPNDPSASAEEHILLGCRLLENMPGMERVIPGIRHHHENVDGSGFPDHLQGDKIPVMARIVAVANRFDHLMTSGGAEGAGLPIKEALIEMSRMGGTVLDKDMVAALFVAHRSGSLFTPKTWIDQPTPKPEEKS